MTTKNTNDLSILIVDDDPFITRSLARILKHQNINNVTTSDSAPIALRKLHSNSEIDIIISDLNMPDLDGIELIRHLGDMPQNISLIIISGENERILQTAEKIALERNINLLGTIKKPVHAATLLSLIEKNQIKPPSKAVPSNYSSLELLLRQVLQNSAISVHYQPQVDANTGNVTGAEALARWESRDLGMVPPSVFIPLAEKLQLIDRLTQQIYSKAIDEFSRCIQVYPHLTLSVNFSFQNLTDLNLPEKLEKKLKKQGLSPKHIVIEITESLLTQDLTTSLDILARLRLKGFGLSIDDFGTGYSTMEQVSRIPFNELKIDRSFVHGAKENKVKRAILESSIDLAKKLGITTVAEGVENNSDLEAVRELGCDIIQGFYYAKPMPIDKLCEWISSTSTNKSIQKCEVGHLHQLLT